MQLCPTPPMAISSNKLHKSDPEVSTQQQRPLTFTDVSEITAPMFVYQRKKLSQPSTVINVSEITAPMFTYKRKKLSQPSTINNVSEITAPMQHVYKRRKLYQPSTGSTDVSEITAPMRFYKRRKLSQPSTGANVSENTAPMLVYKRRKLWQPSPMIVYNRRKLKRGKNSFSCLSLGHSVNDSCSCSPSRSNVELNSECMSKEVEDDTAECSSSSASERDICIEILVRHGVIKEVWPRRRASSSGIRIGGAGCRRCTVCSRSDSTKRMLLCDDCEEAFHMSCISPRISVVPVDEWFCYPCLKKKKPKVWKDASECANTIDSVSGSLGGVSASEPSPIELMLIDGEPYASSVRVGKRFQAEVPDWSGPVL